jgi:hypothetical protein
MATTGKQIMDNIAGIQGAGKDTVFQRNQATISGGVIGMVVGIYWGFTHKHKNLLVTGLFGAIGGAIIARVFVKS